MDALQLDLFAELEKVSDSRKPNLCRSWKNAILNDFGVFIENRVDIEVTKTKKTFYPRVTIHCAMEYPKVYYSFDICGLCAGGGGYPGHDSRHFDVHEHVSNVALMMEHELRARAKGKEFTDKMINECVEKFKTAITSDSSCLPCYEKKVAKAEEIARGFIAEGWRPVPDNESENAKYELGGWIDETKMDATEPRKGTRFFLIDVKSLTWKFFFRKGE